MLAVKLTIKKEKKLHRKKSENIIKISKKKKITVERF